MSTTKVQPPRKLTEEEDLDSFEDWWFQVECYYSRDSKFSQFFDNKTLAWKARSEPKRGLTTDEDATNLNTLLRALATYTSGPYVKNELLDDTRSLKDVRRVFLRFLEIEVTDHSLLNYYTITRRPNERPLVFYHRLRYHIMQHHLPSGTALPGGKTLNADETASYTMERFIIMEWLNRLDSRLIKFIQEKFATELSSSSTYILTIVDSLAKNVDKYISQMDTATVNLVPIQPQGYHQPSMHECPESEEGTIMFGRGGFRGKPPSRGGRSFPRQQFRSSAPQSGRHLPFNQQFKRNPKCEYCYMQSRGNGKSLDFHHNISNCPQMIAKFSNVNMAAVEDDPEDSDNEQEFAEFYDQSL